MGPAANLEDALALIEPVVATVGVRLQGTAKVGEKRRGPVAFMSRGHVEDDLVRARIEIGPETALEAAAGFGEDGDGRVIGLQIVSCRDLPTELVANRRQRRRDIGDPATERAAWQVDALPREDALQPVEREVSRAAESHRRALPEPFVSLSAHTAPSIRPFP
jgi:hypothetical protein